MGPDEEKRIRQIMMKGRQIPEPDWNLFARATGKKSKGGKMLRTGKTQVAKTTTTDGGRFLYSELEDIEAKKVKSKE